MVLMCCELDNSYDVWVLIMYGYLNGITKECRDNCQHEVKGVR